MITKAEYKLLLNEIAKQFCTNAENPLTCAIAVKSSINKFFDNGSFEYFLNHLSPGRYVTLKYSNWRQGSNCRDKIITVTFRDVITGEVGSGTWRYTSENCESKSYYYPDLNTLIGRYGHTLLDVPIKSNSSSDIGRERLIYSPSARPSYNISLVPPGKNPLPKDPPYMPPGAPAPTAPGTGDPGGLEDLFSILSNPIVLGAIAVGGYFIWKGSK